MKSTGPILAAGGVALFNKMIVREQPPDWRVVTGTAIAAGGLALVETFLPKPAVVLSWSVLVAVLFVRLDPGTPAPAEAFEQWYNAK